MGSLWNGIFFITLGSVLTLVFLLVLKKTYQRWTEKVLELFKGKKIIAASMSANFFGQESLGFKQIRGNGVLVLADEELYFRLWIPKKELRISSKQIIDVQSPRSHLGKTKFMPLLKILFKNDKGANDSIAWAVDNLPYWKETLDRIIKND